MALKDDGSKQFSYSNEPIIPVRVALPGAGTGTVIRALIDTGAQATRLDESVARRLRIDLERMPSASIAGGGTTQARFAELSLQLLDEPLLERIVTVGFVPGIAEALGNLLGLDVLSSFDFGLSHSSHLGYLGRTS
jgi:predicted aspartyl protease